MKFLISVDLEGCACVVGEANKSLTASENYEFAKRQAVRETNAAIKALFEKGAKEVFVWDGHGAKLNLDYEKLDERCKIVLGNGWERRMEVLDESFSGLLQIGYHSKDNVADAVLCHTFNSVAFQYIKVNGKELGEIEIDSAIAGKYKVPTIFLSSDDKACKQAQEIIPWIKTIETKKSLSRNMAISLHPKKAALEIYKRVKEAVDNINSMKVYTLDSPVKLEIRYKRIEDAKNAANNNRYADNKIKDPYTVTFTVQNIDEFF